MPRRRPGVLLPLELDILDVGTATQGSGDGFHGFALASALASATHSALIGHGTLYKALARMEKAGLLESAWEDPAIGEREGRPRRRLYRVTAEGATALAAHRQAESSGSGVAARTAHGIAG